MNAADLIWTSPNYSGVDSYQDLPKILRDQIAHFFAHYKDLEPDNWSRVGHWIDREAAEQVIMESIERAPAE